MKDELKDALSSEYVLGTLQGRARQRFQRLLMHSEPLRQSLWTWERHLNQIGTSLPEQKPSEYVWENIQTRLGFADDSKTSQITDIGSARKAKKERSWWMPSAAAAAIVTLCFSVLWFTLPQDLAITEQVAVVQSGKAEALWLIELKADHIEIQATQKLQQHTDKDYELWLVATDGRPPVSLGLLPKQGQLSLPRSQLFDQVQIAALAVSLEPLGGSPSGVPTTVLYTTELITI